MSLLFAVLCILTAALMLILLEVEADIKYSGTLIIVLHINILAVELRKKNKGKEKKQAANYHGSPSGISKLRKRAAYIQLIIKLIEGSELRINSISLPDVFPTDIRTEYIKNAGYSAIISLFTAYLTSKALKLTESAEAYKGGDGAPLLDITLKTRILHVLKSLFVMRTRLKDNKAEELGNG